MSSRLFNVLSVGLSAVLSCEISAITSTHHWYGSKAKIQSQQQVIFTSMETFQHSLKGHNTSHESKTVAECEKLPGTAQTGERGQCLRCIESSTKHHYHPDYPAGNRCRPGNDKP